MRILLVSAEVHPFARTGGLGDVAGSLPSALAALGHDVRVVMPKYARIDDNAHHLLPILSDIQVTLAGKTFTGHVKRTSFPNTSIPVYFLHHAGFFGRPELFGEKGVDYPDNHLRFAFFCKAVIWLLKGLDWVPDIIHCNDWQTALVPVYLRHEPDMLADETLQRTRVLYTIHNLAYQGLFTAEQAADIGIGPELFHPAGLEFYGKLNLMKGGILFADAVSTVSRRYADEIQTKEFGCGLEGVLVQVNAAGRLHGILNGIDTAVWNPAVDEMIPARFTPARPAGKAACKAALQEEVGLPADAKAPLLGIISRLDRQKGFDLIAAVLDDLIADGVQVILLGTGAPEYHELFTAAAARHPRQLAACLRFDNGLAHRIEAGADLFLMPSRFEPCGLNQLYSLKYGTIPVVRRTGGLADSITDATPETVKAGTGTGFVFADYEAADFLAATRRALAAYADKPIWRKIMKNAMNRDFSWDASARVYDGLFRAMGTSRAIEP